MLVKSVNPATLSVNKIFKTLSSKEVFAAAEKARNAFSEWSQLSIGERAEYFKKLANTLRANKEQYAKLMTIEMGKPIKQSLAEIEKCAWTAEFYAENGPKWLEAETIQADGKKHTITFEPLGTILSIMPWNFPFWQALRFGIPTLMAGNATILRHSNVVPLCALAIESAFQKAGFPKNVFQAIITDHDTVGKLIESNLIAGVSLTGSNSAGSIVGSMAGKNIKKCVLELGGSDPFIVLEDADLELTCRQAIIGRGINSGQSCIAAKRFIVVKKVADAFTKKFVELTKNAKIGNPLDQATDVGPLANGQQLSTLEKQVKDAVSKGARVLCGGKKASVIGIRKGFFYEPTVLTNITKDMKVYHEEVFGPVAPIIVVKDEKEAIQVANDSEFGLGASVWTKDTARGERIAKQLQAGCVFVNSIVKSDPRMPFGGIKKSGIGRELSHYGLKEFVNVKGINVY